MKKKTFVKIIHNDPKLYEKFYNKTKNRKYKIKELCNYIYLILKTGMSFRDINELNIKNIPHWNKATLLPYERTRIQSINFLRN